MILNLPFVENKRLVLNGLEAKFQPMGGMCDLVYLMYLIDWVSILYPLSRSSRMDYVYTYLRTHKTSKYYVDFRSLHNKLASTEKISTGKFATWRHHDNQEEQDAQLLHLKLSLKSDKNV